MEDDGSNPFGRMSSRTSKVPPKMAAALSSSDNRTQAAMARLEALENDAGIEMVQPLDDDDASLDDDDDQEVKNGGRWFQPIRRMSSRTRKVAPKMAAALSSSDNRTQAAIARLEALENDAGVEMVQPLDDDEASLVDDDDDQGYVQKKSKGTKRKTRQAKALENARRAPRNFLELLHEANLESLPPHVPTYLRAAVGPPSFTCRRHFCTVCGFTSTYTCVRCGMRFCSTRCQNIHDDTRCQKFVD